MMLKPISPLLALALGLHLSSCFAQENTATDETEVSQVVAVSSVKNPELKPYKQMVKGIDAYQEHRQLAPAAELKFKLIPSDSALSVHDITLRIDGNNTAIAVPVANDGTFTLQKIPSAIDDNADLVSNKKKSLLRWRADIHTPGLPGNARRLGDLRLECEVGWAVGKDDLPFFLRHGLALIGGPCHSQHVALHYLAPQELSAVTLVSGERRQALPISKKNSRIFSPLLADASWGDDAVIEYEFVTTKAPSVAWVPARAAE